MYSTIIEAVSLRPGTGNFWPSELQNNEEKIKRKETSIILTVIKLTDWGLKLNWTNSACIIYSNDALNFLTTWHHQYMIVRGKIL